MPNIISKNSNFNILIVSKFEDLSTNNIQVFKKWKPGYISNFESGELNVMPDLIILDKCSYNQAIVNEAYKLQIPIIEICDTSTPFNILSKIQMQLIM